MILDDPTGYGRVVRAADGSVRARRRDQRPGRRHAAELAIPEVNTGIFAFDGAALLAALGALRDDNAQGELYLPDVLRRPARRGRAVAAHVVDDPALLLGINDRVDLAAVRAMPSRGSTKRTCRPA